ncbi:MAG: hypothetical protein AB1637_04480 [Elusimicrobiota bacterium]
MKFLILSFFLLPNVYSAEFSINKEDIKPSGWDNPLVSTEKEEIAVYKSSKLYVFENKAKQAAQKTLSDFESFGISVLGYNIFEKDGDYGFSVEYMPLLKNPEIISSMLVKKYDHPVSYWNRSLAEESSKETERYLSESPLKTIEIFLKEEREYSFSALYFVNNMLRKGSSYYVLIEKIDLGDFNFENEAEKKSQIYFAKLREMGLAVFSAYPFQAGDNWKVRVEYFSKTDSYKSARPEYSIKTFFSSKLHSFEKDALKYGKKAVENLPSDVFKISVYALEKNGDWYFALDYAVKNLYQKDKVKPEYEIKRYYNPQYFTFESEAKKAMEEKFLSFLKNGLYPLDKEVTEKDGEYGFYIDYFSKNSQNLK